MNLTKAARQLTDGPPPPQAALGLSTLALEGAHLQWASGPVQRGEGSWQLAAC